MTVEFRQKAARRGQRALTPAGFPRATNPVITYSLYGFIRPYGCRCRSTNVYLDSPISLTQ